MDVALCVDALGPQPGGIGRYNWELCKGLADSEEITSLRYVGHRRLIQDPRVLLNGGQLPRRSRYLRPFHDWRMRRALRSHLVHGPNYFLPMAAEAGIITVHDLSVFRYPETHPVERVQAFERLFESSLSRALHVITDTETVRREVIETFGISPDRITAVALGIEDRFRPLEKDSDETAFDDWELVQGRYGLCVSTLEPRKKISELLVAWRLLPADVRAQFPLVLAGGAGWQNDALQGEIRQAEREGWLKYLGFVAEDSLPLLYSGASLFIYPSIYEGFGLPPVEAMASGVPVIVADRSCLPEVCGDAARYVEPNDVEMFAATIRDSLLDEAWREETRALGLRRSAQFTWSRCLDETLSVYRKVINPV